MKTITGFIGIALPAHSFAGAGSNRSEFRILRGGILPPLKQLERFVRGRFLAGSLTLVVSLLFSPVAEAWLDENPSQFPPDVPSSANGDVNYTYEFFAWSHGGASCTLSGTTVESFTEENGTVGPTVVRCKGVVEFQSTHNDASACEPIINHQYCKQSKACTNPPTTYDPNVDDGSGCSYPNGDFYISRVDWIRQHLPASPDITMTHSSGTGWWMDYYYVTSPPLWWYYDQYTCPCDGFTAFPTVFGSSSYYKIVVHIDQGASLPNGTVPTLPGPGHGESPVVVSLTVVDSTAEESPQDLGKFRISRTGDTSSSLVVNYTKGGTATCSPSFDYDLAIGGSHFCTSPIIIPAGSHYVDVDVYPFPDVSAEGSETVILTISPSTSYVIHSPASGTVTIFD